MEKGGKVGRGRVERQSEVEDRAGNKKYCFSLLPIAVTNAMTKTTYEMDQKGFFQLTLLDNRVSLRKSRQEVRQKLCSSTASYWLTHWLTHWLMLAWLSYTA